MKQGYLKPNKQLVQRLLSISRLSGLHKHIAKTTFKHYYGHCQSCQNQNTHGKVTCI
jgi:hypothetical protein